MVPFMLPSSVPLVERWQKDEAMTMGAEVAARALRDDYERWDRWGWGFVAYFGVVVGTLVLGSALAMLISFGAGDVIFAGIVAVIGLAGLAMAVPGGIAMYRLWKTGRRLSRAAAWWLRQPYTLGGRQRDWNGWIETRTVNYEPRIMVRIATCSMSFLIGIFGLSMIFFPERGEMPLVVSTLFCIGLFSMLCAIGQMGGVMNIVRGISERDPFWVRLRESFRKDVG